MECTLTVHTKTAADVIKLSKALAILGGVEVTVEEIPTTETKAEEQPAKEEEPAKKTRTRKTKKKEEQSEEPTPIDGEQPEEEKAVELEDLAKLVELKVADGHREKVVAIFEEVGASKLSEIDVAKYSYVFKQLNAIED